MSSDRSPAVLQPILRSFLASLPPYLCAFGYGSALFPSCDDDGSSSSSSSHQATRGKRTDGTSERPGLAAASLSSPQIDVIVVVEDSRAWHRDNLAANRTHYSGPLIMVSARDRARDESSRLHQHPLPLSLQGGERAIVWSAQHLGVGVHFNTDIAFQDRRIKYGVVDAVDLCRDLEDWDAFFLAGRLQKPVMTTLPFEVAGSGLSPIACRASAGTRAHSRAVYVYIYI